MAEDRPGTMKLRPIDDPIQDGDGYRGDQTIGWRIVYAKGRAVEEFATWCARCLQSWGWTPSPDQARKLHKAMKAHGCPRCAKRVAKSSTKEQKVNDG